MIGKRIAAHLLNRIILFVPSILLLGGISLLIAPNYFIFENDEGSGWLILWLYKYMFFLPTVFLDLFRLPLEFVTILEIILPTLLCFIIIEIITIIFIKQDLGMKIMGLKIISLNGNPLSVIQIIVRTVIKYFSLAFFPFALVYIILNKDKRSFHDKVSRTKVIKSNK